MEIEKGEQRSGIYKKKSKERRERDTNAEREAERF